MTPGFSPEERHALALDASDPLAPFRRRFFIPEDTVYLDGNSLGLMCRESRRSLQGTIDAWRDLGIAGWLEADPPWFTYAENLGEMVAPLVGAEPAEVVATGTTTVNIHALVAGLYRPRGRRTRILADTLNFSSDIYALQGQLALRGMDPKRHLVLVPSSDGRCLDETRIVEAMTEEVSLALLPSVLFRSGQLLDMEYLTREAHKRGILIGFDCSHSVGAVPHRLHDWGVDFGMWCGYKYLNGGPGSTAFLFLHTRHFPTEPRLAGWFGSIKEKQFDFSLEFTPRREAGGWQISSPGIFGAGALHGALTVILEAGIDRIREKSLALTEYLIALCDHTLAAAPYHFHIGSPREARRRGGHVALIREERGWEISQALKRRGIVPDFRPPDMIRLAPVALYNSYHDVWRAVLHLKEIVDRGEHLLAAGERKPIT